ncbi:cysteine hydrolase family protein [Phytopseudomonas dryadis]|uniref:Cysteine hydrolase n=1 Tax=Phytopseudomonas dryadis TaxID=2487520 RepID=A0A4Q9QT41_9GAMM|nr:MULTISPECIES: cysteine hydrolase family protein [Pseudomonas]TBU85585.1 cysteine hydrolase [Pseudomonas dryadis]TBV08366.1 cysteine hydrolase [Pseudomonas dryadis]TBV19857.1 cysteine hydrolase [Pseudomonas sp. FRB 230]
MSHPQTFYQLTGRGHAPASLSNATLLVIDAQEEYRSGVVQLPGLDAALAEIAKLLDAARRLGGSIVHVKHLGIPGGLLDPRGPRGAHLPEVAPLPGEIVVEKRMPNAFSGTDLHEKLQSLGHLDLVVCGFMTHSSISTTIRATKDYGYRCTVVDAACATRDLPTPDGQVISAAEMHRFEMIALADNFAAWVPEASALI